MKYIVAPWMDVPKTFILKDSIKTDHSTLPDFSMIFDMEYLEPTGILIKVIYRTVLSANDNSPTIQEGCRIGRNESFVFALHTWIVERGTGFR